MKITVILCTYNRCGELTKALSSVTASTLPNSTEWEVLVVDNNSTDQTAHVVEEFSRRYPGRVRYLFEPRPGKSNALNAGIQEARGDILAFMDDDVTVDSTWLKNLTANLYNGTWAGAGGRILPQWNCPPPPWIPLSERSGLAPLAMFDLGPAPGPLAEAPVGTNMAFQKKVFEKYGVFRTDLGPRPGSEIRNEDTEFGKRVLSSGERLRYEPSAVVHHPVSPNRIKKRYFLTWWFDKARADIREFGIPTDTRWFFAGVPLYFFRRLLVWTLRWIVTLDPSSRFSNKLNVWGNVGRILECSRISLERRKTSAVR
jgi:glycosyltransferase involved in cell wall biosynthesis